MEVYDTQEKSTGSTSTTATAGLFLGFGGLTYSGGQVLSTTPNVWDTQTQN